MKTHRSESAAPLYIVLMAICGAMNAAALANPHASSDAAPAIDEELRCEILHMKEVDQEARMAAIKDGLDLNALEKINREIDDPNTERMKKIIAQHGWPGKSLVGQDGAFAAWLLVQHATHDVKFMEDCLALMQAAADRGEASRKDLALLTDRVRIRQGKPQLYGTQLKQGPDGEFVPEPIEDEEHLEERRKEMGLSSMADEARRIRQTYHKRSAAPLK
jgi:hypothetical protein